jgi:hypothetical protein
MLNRTTHRSSFRSARPGGLRPAVALLAAALALPAIPSLSAIGIAPAFANGGGGGGGDHGGGGGDHGGGGGDHGGGAGADRGPGHDASGGAANGRGNDADKNAKANASEPTGRARDAAAGRQAEAANLLGRLNAAHASPTALAHASPHSAVGAVAAYRAEMRAALKIDDPVARQAAIDMARIDLARTSNKELTAASVARVDSLLGLPASPPTAALTLAERTRESEPEPGEPERSWR